jgi:hypothetical protein
MKKITIKNFTHAEVDSPKEMFGFLKIPVEHKLVRAWGENLEVSDGYHTIDELYEFRKIYNAILFNEWAKQGIYQVHKSRKHHDGERCFGGGWFIVVATLPSGDISNHYELSDWDLFRCEEHETAKEWDGHDAKDVLERLKLLSSNSSQS